MSRRTRKTLLIVAALLVLVALAVFLRSKAPPEAARLLPESDGIIYIDLRPIRAVLHKELKPPQHSAEYQEFIDAIGIDPERDLDQVAIALHRMPDPSGPNGPVAYSMVLVGKITGQRLNAWLDAHATSRESYDGHTVYSIPSEGRTVRVAQIGYDTIAASNFPTPEKIHSILDRHRTAAWPLSGSTLLQQHYHDVPLLSLAWGVGQIGLPFSESGSIHIFGLALPLEPDSTIIASLRWLPIRNSFGRSICAWKKLPRLKQRPPARPPIWPRWSPWPAALPRSSAPTPPTTASRSCSKPLKSRSTASAS